MARVLVALALLAALALPAKAPSALGSEALPMAEAVPQEVAAAPIDVLPGPVAVTEQAPETAAAIPCRTAIELRTPAWVGRVLDTRWRDVGVSASVTSSGIEAAVEDDLVSGTRSGLELPLPLDVEAFVGDAIDPTVAGSAPLDRVATPPTTPLPSPTLAVQAGLAIQEQYIEWTPTTIRNVVTIEAGLGAFLRGDGELVTSCQRLDASADLPLADGLVSLVPRTSGWHTSVVPQPVLDVTVDPGV